MHADIFLDTNILLYAASKKEGEQEKRKVARGLLSRDGVGLSVQVLAEFYVNAISKLKLPEDQVLRVLEKMRRYPVLPVDEGVFWSALEIRKRYGISYWDSAILAAAIELGCGTVFSEDLSDGQSYAGVKVVNPFV
jgi:predicted nucleic acid-binding protein